MCTLYVWRMLIFNEGRNNKDTIIYHIAGYIGRNNVWRIARKQKKIAIGRYKFGGYWYDHHAFSGSLRNIGRFNIGGVTGNPPIHQI